MGDSDIGPETVDTVLTHNLNSTTTYVAFEITGDLYLFDYWHIDDVEITRATSPKVDFNGDGQEDILWRYYGPGGYNRAWFLGDLGPGSPALLPRACPWHPIQAGSSRIEKWHLERRWKASHNDGDWLKSSTSDQHPPVI